MAKSLLCIILGAAGRDFHDFQMFFRDRPEFKVVAFTATQIPFIEHRRFPKELAGPLYDADIPIFPEDELAALIKGLEVDLVVLAYSTDAVTMALEKGRARIECASRCSHRAQARCTRPIRAWCWRGG